MNCLFYIDVKMNWVLGLYDVMLMINYHTDVGPCAPGIQEGGGEARCCQAPGTAALWGRHGVLCPERETEG